MPLPKKHILLSGGGTGGHIFPAIAIANALKEMVEDGEFLFIGARGRMEMEKVPKAGYAIKGIWISGFQRKLTLRNLLFPLKVLASLVAVGRIIRQFKPDVVIGTGGYASGPALKMAARRKIPSLILEQNSFPGMTNRLLARQVTCICVAHPGMERYFPAEKMVLTGNPVREDMVNIAGKKVDAIRYFGLETKKTTVLIIGGSQGALSINRAVAAHLVDFGRLDLQLIWQTGPAFHPQAIEMVAERSFKCVHVHSFIERMDFAYAAADIVISRAGAIAISELCLVKKPAILVPLPHAAEDHQAKNAMALVEKQAALMIRDDQLVEQLPEVLAGLVNDREKQQRLRQNIGKLGQPDAARRIATEAIQLMNR